MAPNQGDNVQQKARQIATAFETGVDAKDMKPAITALQDAARGNPNEYRQILQTANQMLDNSGKANVKKFFGNYDLVEGTDGQGLRVKRNADNQQFVIGEKGSVTQVGTGARMEAPQKDGYGNRIEKVVDKDGTTKERIVGADGRSSLEKYTDKAGNHWEIEKRMQADGTLRPTKITMPDGSSFEYEWNRQMGDRGNLLPTRIKESDRNGRLVRDYEMKMADATHRNPAHWERKAGNVPAQKEFYGTIMVDSNNNTTFTFRDPLATETVNADGTWSKGGFANGKRVDEKGRRTK